jgi:predicted nucleic acid-binding protein
MTRFAFDSCFLIDYERERAGRKISAQNSPTKFLEENSVVELAISPTALAEFAIGFSDFKHMVLKAVLENFEVLNTSVEVSLCYAKIYQDLATRKTLIGSNDMWIAAYSLTHKVPLVTNNIKDFSKISGLSILTY